MKIHSALRSLAKRKLLLAALAIALLPLRPLELEAWPGLLWSGANALCSFPTWTPASGGIYSSTNLSGAGVANGTFTTSNAASPDGTTDASTFVENTSNGGHQVIIPSAPASVSLTGAQFTVSIWVKRGVGTRNVALLVFNAGFASFSFTLVDLGTCAVSGTSANSFGSSAYALAVPLNGGCEITLSSAGVTTTAYQVQFSSISAGSATYTGDGASSLVYGQAEISSP